MMLLLTSEDVSGTREHADPPRTRQAQKYLQTAIKARSSRDHVTMCEGVQRRTRFVPGSDLRCCHRREIPANQGKPTRGLEPRTPSLRVMAITPTNPCTVSFHCVSGGLEPAVNPPLHAIGRTAS